MTRAQYYSAATTICNAACLNPPPLKAACSLSCSGTAPGTSCDCSCDSDNLNDGECSAHCVYPSDYDQHYCEI